MNFWVQYFHTELKTLMVFQKDVNKYKLSKKYVHFLHKTLHTTWSDYTRLVKLWLTVHFFGLLYTHCTLSFFVCMCWTNIT